MTISPVTANQTVGSASVKQTGSAQGTDFAAAISEALKDEFSQKAISMTAGSGSSGLSGMGMTGMTSEGGAVESMILAAAASGQADDTQMAVMMLLMMLQNESSGEMSQLFSAMAALISRLDAPAQKQIYNDTMNAEAEPEVLLELESGIFLNADAIAYHESTELGAVVPEQAWKAATPAVTSDESDRSPERLKAVISQFDVENAERYRPFKNGSTYCNIFLWDVTSAMGAEIPHYVDAQTGEPRQYPDVSGARELNANATHDWLAQNGESYGWREVTAAEAQQWANEGKPAVTAWRNSSDKPGHVQIVTPSADGGFDSVRGVTVAQAGSTVTEYAHISSTFKQADLKNVKYYIHD